MSTLMLKIIERGETPFLHARKDNTVAIRVYERLGFKTRAIFPFHVLRYESSRGQAK